MSEHDSASRDLSDPNTQSRPRSARWPLRSWLILLHLYAVLLTLIVAAFLFAENDRDFSWIISELDNKGIVKGDPATELIPAKPVLQEARYRSDGTEFWMAAFRAKGNVLLVYVKDGNLFAANYIHAGSTPLFEHWYFCDSEVMDEYIQLALHESSD